MPTIDDLTRLLEQRRSALHGLPGVVATGVGMRSVDGPVDDIVVSIHVSSPEHVAPVETAARSFFGDRFVVTVVGAVVAAV